MTDITFFSSQTANASSDAVVMTGDVLTVQASGTWDTATATFEASVDGTTFVPLADATFTADGVADIYAAPGTSVRCTISSVGASTSLDAFANRQNKVCIN